MNLELSDVEANVLKTLISEHLDCEVGTDDEDAAIDFCILSRIEDRIPRCDGARELYVDSLTEEDIEDALMNAATGF